MIALDSDVLIEILDRKSEKGAEAFKRILASGEEVCTTVISVHEVMFGMQKFGKPVKEPIAATCPKFTQKMMKCFLSKLELVNRTNRSHHTKDGHVW